MTSIVLVARAAAPALVAALLIVLAAGVMVSESRTEGGPRLDVGPARVVVSSAHR